jgi:uncharacterized RDD family membrane protein YckC
MTTNEPSAVDAAPPVRYATFTGRVRALLVDTCIVAVGLVVVVVGSDFADGIPGSGRIAWLAMFALVVMYEPVLIWRRGATIGHARNHLRVVRVKTRRTPGLLRAFARYVAKVILGLPSFVTMAFTRKHQAVHDWLTETVVEVVPDADPRAAPFYVERQDDADEMLPSAARRITIVVAYLIGLFVLYAIVQQMVDPGGCARERSCVGGQRIAVEALALAWLAISFATIIAGWKGSLPGARRTPISSDQPVA